ncbi:MAG: N-acetylmuramoyl-L-alanine amidase [Lentisphaerae bacterium]|nr:N-acetylmuramoyl-L-alanine amidase [Lentisphaerota bacterium]
MMKKPLVTAAVVCLVVLLPATCPAAFQIRCASLSGRTYVFLSDVARYYGMKYHPGQKTVRLTSKYSDLRFTLERRECVLNTVSVHLSFAPRMWKRNPTISETDFRLMVDPVLRPKCLPKGTVKRIMIDPGHGGKDHGATGRKYREKDVNYSVCRILVEALRKQGYTVSLTRGGDTKLSLERRAKLARAWRADLFISVHANYVATKSVRGAETFLLSPKGTPSTYGNKSSKSLSLGNAFDKQNARAAYEIHKGLKTATKSSDRGVKHARFLVLRDAPCPALLVEMGFLSNSTEESLLGSARHQRKVADGIVQGVRRYHQSLLQGGAAK